MKNSIFENTGNKREIIAPRRYGPFKKMGPELRYTPQPPKTVSDWIFLQALEEEAQSEVEKMILHTAFQNKSQEVIIILLELLSLTESAYLKRIQSFQQHLCKHVSMPATDETTDI